MKLSVNLAERSYAITIAAGAFAAGLEAVKERKANNKSKIVCVADAAVLSLNPDKAASIGEFADIISVEGGEGSKCFEKFAQLSSELALRGADRKSALVAWGGGVVGDLTGYLAASYMRGIEFYQMPTTLLAMVDSSVGGKTGINIPEGKNLVGAFHQPVGVFADIDFLKTLPPREFAAGMAEVVKCALIGDFELFSAIKATKGTFNPESPYLPESIRRSCALKARVVAADERESAASGGRALLNLGHTFAHAIEKTSGFGAYLHGEAVAIGLVMAAQLSADLGYANVRAEVEETLKKCALPVRLSARLPMDDFMEAISHDKKNAGGALKFVLIDRIGKAFTQVVEREKVVRVVSEFLG